MNAEDRRAIERLAGAKTRAEAIPLRADAVSAYIRNLPTECQANAHMRFMSEVDSAVPDLMLRARYRAQVLAEASETK